MKRKNLLDMPSLQEAVPERSCVMEFISVTKTERNLHSSKGWMRLVKVECSGQSWGCVINILLQHCTEILGNDFNGQPGMLVCIKKACLYARQR